MFSNHVTVVSWTINTKKEFSSLHLNQLSNAQVGAFMVENHLVAMFPNQPYGKQENNVPWHPLSIVGIFGFCISG